MVKNINSLFLSNSREAEPLFSGPSIIQPKLTIGQPDDPYEREADSMAEKVVGQLESSKSSSSIQAKCEACEQEDKLQRKEDEGNEMETDEKTHF